MVEITDAENIIRQQLLKDHVEREIAELFCTAAWKKLSTLKVLHTCSIWSCSVMLPLAQVKL